MTSVNRQPRKKPIVQKKICMLGSFAVGKTSLVARFVRSIFSEAYHTTVGVKIDKKLVELPGARVKLILWDLHGEDEFQRLQTTYLRGSAGYVLVVDGTRRDTLESAASLHARARAALGPVPYTLAINKSDLLDMWEIEEAELDPWRARDAVVARTSAKTGAGVEELLVELAARTLGVERGQAVGGS